MSVTTAAGFLAGAVVAGLKPSGKADLALVAKPDPASTPRPCSPPTG